MSSFQPWHIQHLELSDPIPPELALETGYQGVCVVFWWHQIPLGHCEFLATQLPIPATHLINIAVQTITPAAGDRLFEHGFNAPLPIVRKRSPQKTLPNFDAVMALKRPLAELAERSICPDQTSVSVVVCTRDRPAPLVDCLRSLQELVPPPSEIVVVDNAPTSDATRQQVAQFPNVRYVVEPQPGLSVARNTGIRYTTGDLIAFTDDDVRVHPSWISHIQQTFCDPQIMAMTGLVLPGELETEAQVIFEKGLGGFGQGYRIKTFDQYFFKAMSDRGVPVWRIGAGANMAFRRTVFERVGDFDERLGAGAAGCSEDSELWYRILTDGGVCRYEPSAVVFHFHRGSLDSLKQQAFQYMRGHVAALLIQFQNHGHWGNLHRLGVALPRYYSKLVQQGLRNGLRNRYSTLFAEISGCLSGIRFYLSDRRSQKSLKGDRPLKKA
ncbi:MAG: glycosyltransferase family 2 protein [Elainellaceae cyanobacterium]